MPALRRILAADVPQGIQTLRNVLTAEAEIVVASTMEEAMSLLKGGADLIVCGIHFDESRMFDLLRVAKADPATRPIPFLCFRDMESELAQPVLESLQIACNALGAVAFVDLFQLRSVYGVREAHERFRHMLLGQMPTM